MYCLATPKNFPHVFIWCLHMTVCVYRVPMCFKKTFGRRQLHCDPGERDQQARNSDSGPTPDRVRKQKLTKQKRKREEIRGTGRVDIYFSILHFIATTAVGVVKRILTPELVQLYWKIQDHWSASVSRQQDSTADVNIENIKRQENISSVLVDPSIVAACSLYYISYDLSWNSIYGAVGILRWILPPNRNQRKQQSHLLPYLHIGNRYYGGVTQRLELPFFVLVERQFKSGGERSFFSKPRLLRQGFPFFLWFWPRKNQ